MCHKTETIKQQSNAIQPNDCMKLYLINLHDFIHKPNLIPQDLNLKARKLANIFLADIYLDVHYHVWCSSVFCWWFICLIKSVAYINLVPEDGGKIHPQWNFFRNRSVLWSFRSTKLVTTVIYSLDGAVKGRMILEDTMALESFNFYSRVETNVFLGCRTNSLEFTICNLLSEHWNVAIN